MFDSTKNDLKEMLKDIDEGKLQLPDFQRDYVWGDYDVRSLIASIAKGYPVGALLTLQTGGDIAFKPRLLTGVAPKDISPKELLLDGQQRLTSLYQSMWSTEPVTTRTPQNKKVKRYYYLDINKSLESGADIEEAIIGVPSDKKLRSNFGRDIHLDLSSQEHEFEQNTFPLNKAFDNRNWFFKWRNYWSERGRDIDGIEEDFYKKVIECIERYKMPIIRLDNNNSREAICLVFEKVNVGGKKLDAFELVTAIYAANEFDLRLDWHGFPTKSTQGRKARMIGDQYPRDVLKEIANTDFLQSCTLLHTHENRLDKIREGLKGKNLPQVTCKRDALLNLPLEAYRKHADSVEKGFTEASSFLNELKIIWNKDVPYPSQIVALASTFAYLGRNAQTVSAKEKLARWFWSVTFGELYGSSTETRLARDVQELIDWISCQEQKPRSMDEALFQIDRLRTLRTRNSAAYKGIHALLMKHGCKDFITGRSTDIMTFFNDKIDIHHIFPVDWCKKQGIVPKIFNSIVNKTPLSKSSNSTIGGSAPSVYLKHIEDKFSISEEALNNILRTHLIEPEHLRTDDFDAFYETRIKQLAKLVSDAMDKPVVEEHGANEEEEDDDVDTIEFENEYQETV